MLMLLTMLYSLAGIIKNLAFFRGTTFRYSLGTDYPTDFSAHIFYPGESCRYPPGWGGISCSGNTGWTARRRRSGGTVSGCGWSLPESVPHRPAPRGPAGV